MSGPAFPPPGAGYPPPGSPPPPSAGPSMSGLSGPGALPDPPSYPPAYPPAPPGAVLPPPALRAAHRPGAIPLRPLTLGDLYDGAFKIIRFNPTATVGSAVVVTAVAMLVPVLVTAVLSWTVGLSLSALEPDSGTVGAAETLGIIGAYAALFLGSLLQWLGMVFVTGMNAHVAAAAARGSRLSLAASWSATRGKRWRLLGLVLLIFLSLLMATIAVVLLVVLIAVTVDTLPAVLLGVATAVLSVGTAAFLWIRVAYLAVPPLMLEPVGVFGALGRAWGLTRRQFWRTFGIALLTLFISYVAGGLLSAPVAVVGQLLLLADPAGVGMLLYVVSAAIGSVLSAALVAPFVTTVTSLQYLDQRIRKEAYDVELMARVGAGVP